MADENKNGTANIIIENRKRLFLSGVTDTESFNEESVTLYTNCGKLNIKGQNLHISKLSVESGDVAIEGDVVSISYSEEKSTKNESFFSRLFK